jgi:predicted RNase H-like HicB family nuclease
MTIYVGILDGGGKTYGVRIPDLPGCYGGGVTPEAAIADAMAAAQEWITRRAAKGEAAPIPSTMMQVRKSEKIIAARNEAAVVVRVAGKSSAQS